MEVESNSRDWTGFGVSGPGQGQRPMERERSMGNEHRSRLMDSHGSAGWASAPDPSEYTVLRGLPSIDFRSTPLPPRNSICLLLRGDPGCMLSVWQMEYGGHRTEYTESEWTALRSMTMAYGGTWSPESQDHTARPTKQQTNARKQTERIETSPDPPLLR